MLGRFFTPVFLQQAALIVALVGIIVTLVGISIAALDLFEREQIQKVESTPLLRLSSANSGFSFTVMLTNSGRGDANLDTFVIKYRSDIFNNFDQILHSIYGGNHPFSVSPFHQCKKGEILLSGGMCNFVIEHKLETNDRIRTQNLKELQNKLQGAVIEIEHTNQFDDPMPKFSQELLPQTLNSSSLASR